MRTSTDPARCTDPGRWAAERARVFRGLPCPVAHSEELPEDGSFLTGAHAAAPMLLARGRDGAARAFGNVCRHRGATPVEHESGCRHRFACPCHGWTWEDAGRLIAVPAP